MLLAVRNPYVLRNYLGESISSCAVHARIAAGMTSSKPKGFLTAMIRRFGMTTNTVIYFQLQFGWLF